MNEDAITSQGEHTDNIIGIIYAKLPIAVGVAFIITGLSFWGLLGFRMTFLGFAIVFMGIGVFLIWWVWSDYNVHSPIGVDIGEGGFTAYFRYGKPKFVDWNDILQLNYFAPDPSKLGIAKMGEGNYVLKNEFPFRLLPEVAYAIREAYHRDMGKYPPTMYDKRK